MATAQEIAIAAAKKKWSSATTDAQRAAAKAEADAARGYNTNASGTLPATEADAMVLAKRSAEGAGVDPSTIDPAYVQALLKGTTQQYTNAAIAQGQANKTAAAVKPGSVAGATGAPSAGTSEGMIRDMYGNLIKAGTAGIDAATGKTVSDLNEQIAQAPGTYQPLRNQVDVATARSIQSQNEVAAAKGTAFSGGVASNVSGTQNTGEVQKTALTQQELNVVNSIKKSVADAKAAGEAKKQELIATTGAQQAGALLQDKYRSEDNAYRAGRDTVADTRYAQDQAAAQQSAKAEQARYENEFNYKVSRDQVADGKWLQEMQSTAANQAAGRAVQWAGYNLDKAKFEWSLSPDNPDNVLKDESKSYATNYKRMWDAIQSTTKQIGPTGEQIDVPRFDNDDIYNMILSSGMSLQDSEKMIKSLGVKVPGDNFWGRLFGQ